MNPKDPTKRCRVFNSLGFENAVSQKTCVIGNVNADNACKQQWLAVVVSEMFEIFGMHWNCITGVNALF